MRKLVMIVLATALFGAQAAAAPVNFATTPQATAPPAARTGSVLASSPLATPANPATASKNRFGRWFSSARPSKNAPTQHAVPPNRSSVTGAPILPTSRPAVASVSSARAAGPSQASPTEVLVSLAKTAETQGNADGARELLQRAVGAAPSNPATLRAAGHFEDRQGKLEVAESLYRRAIASDTASAASLNDLAICLARQNRMQESAETFHQAIALSPTKALYRNNIAKVLVELGDLAGAMGQLSAVHSKSVTHYNLGYLLSAKGDNAAAQQQYQLALAADPSLAAARNALAALLAPAANQVASLPAPQALPAAPVGPIVPVTPPVPTVTPLVTGAPITPAAPVAGNAPGFAPVAPGYAPAVASPYYYPPQGVQQR